MNAYLDLVKALLKRSTIALPLLALGLSLLFRGGADIFSGFAIGLLGCAAVLAGAIALAFPLAGLLAQPTGSIYFSEKKADGPQPAYGIPESLSAKGQYEDALAEYARIIATYPQEVKAYI